MAGAPTKTCLAKNGNVFADITFCSYHSFRNLSVFLKGNSSPKGKNGLFA